MRSQTVCVFAMAMLILAGPAAHAAPPEEPAPEPAWASAVRPFLENGEYANAARLLKDYLRQVADADAEYAYLYCLYENGNYTKVSSLAARSQLPGATEDPRRQILVGLTRWQQGDLLGALQCWTDVLAANPGEDRAWECLWVGLLTVPSRVRIPVFERVRTGLRGSPFASQFLMGTLYYVRGDYGEAEKRFDEARQLFPESRAVALSLREIYRHTGNQEACRPIDEWLSSGQDTDRSNRSNRSYRSNVAGNSNIINGLYVKAAPHSRLYRLPWPAGKTFYCPSHEGRRETPHAGRGRYALDFYLPQVTPVLAARAGVVCVTAERPDPPGEQEFDTFILINHGDGTFGRYCHLRGASRVRVGQQVRQGDILAEVGRTGVCQDRHLHFDVVRQVRWRLSGPKIYDTWETVPVDFEETPNLEPQQIPGSWLTSANRVAEK